jgi:hypothetical protein
MIIVDLLADGGANLGEVLRYTSHLEGRSTTSQPRKIRSLRCDHPVFLHWWFFAPLPKICLTPSLNPWDAFDFFVSGLLTSSSPRAAEAPAIGQSSTSLAEDIASIFERSSVEVWWWEGRNSCANTQTVCLFVCSSVRLFDCVPICLSVRLSSNLWNLWLFRMKDTLQLRKTGCIFLSQTVAGSL